MYKKSIPLALKEGQLYTMTYVYRSAREYMQTCAFFIYQQLHFKIYICKKCYIDYRRKLHSVREI